jgi:hypothetical protein
MAESYRRLSAPIPDSTTPDRLHEKAEVLSGHHRRKDARGWIVEDNRRWNNRPTRLLESPRKESASLL